MPQNLPHFYRGRFSVAPMLDWTTRHCRYFHRQFSKHALLYTEMVTAPAIIHAKYDHLDFDLQENPVALQLGGSDPEQLKYCAKLAEEQGYHEINLNVGCPSDRVQNGMFGACLMAKADLVGKGCQEFIIHARKAWLSGLSPKENREIPPLDYARVYQLKRDFPQLTISINGSIKTIEEIKQHLQYVDGVMVGREAYQNPSLLGQIDQALFDPNAPIVTAHEAVQSMLPYIEQQLNQGIHLNHIVRHMLGAFQNCKGARQWRRYLSENAFKQGAGIEVVETALSFVENES